MMTFLGEPIDQGLQSLHPFLVAQILETNRRVYGLDKVTVLRSASTKATASMMCEDGQCFMSPEAKGCSWRWER